MLRRAHQQASAVPQISLLPDCHTPPAADAGAAATATTTRRKQTPLATTDPNTTLARFEQTILPHLDAAYNLARWLTGHEQDAQDVVQDACVRAFRSFGGFYGENGRAWLLTIVRHAAYDTLQKNKPLRLMTTTFDEELHGGAESSSPGGAAPAQALRGVEDEQRIAAAIAALPAEFREAIVLRHQDGLSYKEIADIAGVPSGTVMSRLARARARLKQLLAGDEPKEAIS